MTSYQKRKEIKNKREAWVCKQTDIKFRKIIPNFEKWVNEKMLEEIEKAGL